MTRWTVQHRADAMSLKRPAQVAFLEFTIIFNYFVSLDFTDYSLFLMESADLIIQKLVTC